MNCNEYSPELHNFAFVLRGEVKHLKKIKECLQEYVEKEEIKMVNPTYDKEEIYIITGAQWKEYQRLKNRGDGLIGWVE